MCQSQMIILNQDTGWRKVARCRNFCMMPVWTPNPVLCSDSIQEYTEKSAVEAGWRNINGKRFCPICAPIEQKFLDHYNGDDYA